MNVIYAISCEDRYYIGSTKNFFKRKAEHTGLLEKGKHSNQYMQRVYDKYRGLHFKILENVDVEGDLLEREQVHIDRHYSDPKCMNLSPHAHRGYNQWSAESRAKMSESCKGRVYGPEVKLKQSLAKKGKIGGVHSNPFTFKWNDKEYKFVSATDFTNTFTTSAITALRQCIKNGTWIVGSRTSPVSKHPFKSGDVLIYLPI
tara:strand:+ start:83 stop:688 length:606 start_codon:yes stop_codon:yes gene_type:complete